MEEAGIDINQLSMSYSLDFNSLKFFFKILKFSALFTYQKDQPSA